MNEKSDTHENALSRGLAPLNESAEPGLIVALFLLVLGWWFYHYNIIKNQHIL